MREKRHKQENYAALQIQTRWRGHNARKRVASKKRVLAMTDDDAALKIQCRWKGHQARKYAKKKRIAKD
jgi:hypothetical protein